MPLLFVNFPAVKPLIIHHAQNRTAKSVTATIKNEIRSGKSLGEAAFLIADTISTSSISYDLLRKIGKKRRYGVQDKLDYGRAIIEKNEELEQYWYSYAPMIQRQWKFVLPKIKLPAGDLEIVDYGCGQGGASALFLDKFRKTHRATQVTLIEPSAIALDSAREIVQCYLPDATLTTVQKELGNLTPNDGLPQSDTTRVHIFSNILDVPSVDIENLATTVNDFFCAAQSNIILAVSHSRDFSGGIIQFEKMRMLLENNSSRVLFREFGEFPFEVSNRTRKAVYFILHLNK